MSGNQKNGGSILPGGIKRSDYMWPRLSVTHPEHGLYEMDVHCVRNPTSGAATLMAFLGHTKPNSPERTKQIDVVAQVSKDMGNVIEALDESEIGEDIAVELAAHFYAHPDANIAVMSVLRQSGL